LVFFSWLTAQSYFKEVTNSDIRQKLLDERNLQLDEETLPVGFINDGQQEEKTFDGKDLWETVRSRGYTSSGFEFNK